MTGFARVRKTIEEGEVVVSVKSVNHRGLDLHLHLPAELEAFETDVRNAIKGRLTRGHVQLQASFTPAAAAAPAPLNHALLDAYLRAFREAAATYGIEGRPDLNAALRLPGMLNAGAEQAEAAEPVARAAVAAAVEATESLNAAREVEGAALAREMRQRCRQLAVLVDRMREIRAGAVEAFQRRLCERLAELLRGAGLDAQRLAQEAAVLADRSDIAEELVRLETHTEALDAMLAGDGEVGKRIDFLLQEMNREANTILSKTGGLGELGLTITELALAAKSEIEKIREQSLNLE